VATRLLDSVRDVLQRLAVHKIAEVVRARSHQRTFQNLRYSLEELVVGRDCARFDLLDVDQAAATVKAGVQSVRNGLVDRVVLDLRLILRLVSRKLLGENARDASWIRSPDAPQVRLRADQQLTARSDSGTVRIHLRFARSEE